MISGTGTVCLEMVLAMLIEGILPKEKFAFGMLSVEPFMSQAAGVVSVGHQLGSFQAVLKYEV
jgi:hypothetical protein